MQTEERRKDKKRKHGKGRTDGRKEKQTEEGRNEGGTIERKEKRKGKTEERKERRKRGKGRQRNEWRGEGNRQGKKKEGEWRARREREREKWKRACSALSLSSSTLTLSSSTLTLSHSSRCAFCHWFTWAIRVPWSSFIWVLTCCSSSASCLLWMTASSKSTFDGDEYSEPPSKMTGFRFRLEEKKQI